MPVKLLLILLVFPCLISSDPIELSDRTWKEMLHDQWMVEFYAPWCSACQQFKPVWAEFANVMESKNIKVAAVDVDRYPSLSGRFGISALPTIYYVRDGVFRQYSGQRSLRSLSQYIDNQEWQKTSPISSYFGPSSILMSLASSLFDISTLVKDTHESLQDYYGWPSWLIYTIFVIGALSVGILIGFSFLQILDYCLGGSSKSYANTVPEEADELEESDTDKVRQAGKQTTDESQGDEELELDENNSSNEEEEETPLPATTDQTVRQRQLKTELSDN